MRTPIFFALLLACCVAFAQDRPAYTITTVAGADAVRDGGRPVDAILGSVLGVAVDAAGNLYLADSTGRIRKVTPLPSEVTMEPHYAYGRIETVAGVGGAWYNGDDIPAAEAYLANPSDVAVDAEGNLYVADTTNARIRKIGTDGVIRTVAGRGAIGFSPDGTPAAEAALALPTSIALDAEGSIYFTEAGPGRVRKIAGDGTLATVAGGGGLDFQADGGPATNARLLSPAGLCFDRDGNLLVVETGRAAVRKIARDGTIATVAGTGQRGAPVDGAPAAASMLATPRAVAVDPDDNVYIGDPGNLGAFVVTPDGAIRRIFPPLAAPMAMTYAPGRGLFLSFGLQVNMWMPGYTSLGAPIVGGWRQGRNEVPAIQSLVYAPADVALGASGEIYIAEPSTAAVRVVDGAGVIHWFGGNPIGKVEDGQPVSRALLMAPRSLASDAAGNLWIADGALNRIFRVAAGTGSVETVAGNGMAGSAAEGAVAKEAPITSPRSVAVDGNGNVYFSENATHRVRKVAADGTITTLAGSGQGGFAGDDGPAGPARLYIPSGLAPDGAGNVYIADTGNNRVRKVAADGTITTVAGGGTSPVPEQGEAPALDVVLRAPAAVAVDGAGNLYIACYHSVLRVDGAGMIARIAGADRPGLGGDGEAAAALLNGPAGLKVDTAGNIYVVDAGNHRIVKLTAR